jgi:hypothetical protein
MNNPSPSMRDDRDKFNYPADYQMGLELNSKKIHFVDAIGFDGLFGLTAKSME